MLWHPYKQSVLKGDVPVIGQDIFLDLTASTETVFEGRRVPTPSGVSASQPGSSPAEFFGQSEQIFVVNNFSFSVDLFRGDTVFQPVHWALHLQPVYNVNYLQTQETGVVSRRPARSSVRSTTPIRRRITAACINPGDIDGLLNGQLTTGDPVNQEAVRARGTRRGQAGLFVMSLQEAFVRIASGRPV